MRLWKHREEYSRHRRCVLQSSVQYISCLQHLSAFLQELRDAKRVDPDVPIYTHGEKECISMEKVRRKGIDVNVSTVAEMVNICNYLGMDSVAYLGQVDVSNAKIGTYEKVYK